MKNHVTYKSYGIKKTNTIFVLTSAIIVLCLLSINSSYAFGFLQTVRIHIDKGEFNLGNYAILLKDLDTNHPLTKQYTDSADSPQNLVSTWTINTSDGNRLQACMAKVTTSEIVCDDRTANSAVDEIDFYLNWADRQTV